MFRLHGHFPHYFNKHLPLQLEELYLSSAIMDFANSAIMLFEPIYLWMLGYTLQQIMGFYLLLYAVYFFAAPLGGKFVARFGHERSIMISTLWLVAYVFALIEIKSTAWLYYIAPVLLAVQKSFYWPAYHFDFMRFSLKEERGKEYSGIWALSSLMFTLGPIAAAFTVKLFGFSTMFWSAIVLILLSSIPLFAFRAGPKREAFSYWKSLVLPFRRRYWRNTVGYLGLGSELVLLAVWPIFISLVFKDLFNVGLLVGLSAFITAVVTLLIGKWTDRSPRTRVLSFGTVGNVGVWLLRLLSRSAPVVFVLDVLGRITHNTTYVSTTALTYDPAHEDDYSWHGVYYEQGFAIAKSLTALTIIAFASSGDPFMVSFLVAALFSLFHLVL